MIAQKPTAIVFDCFGVLFDDAFKAVLVEHEHHLPKPIAYYYKLDALNGDGVVSDADYYRELSTDLGVPVDELKERFHDTHCRIEGTASIIQELKEKSYRIGLLSNITRSMLDEFLAYQNTRRLFDETLASSEAGAIKPERKIFEIMAERLQTPFTEWFFIDDSSTNVEAAKSYGIDSYLFTSPAKLRTALQERSIL